MTTYSMDLRTRVIADYESGMSSKDVAVKYSVSSAWVRRLAQRKRETGSFAPKVYVRRGPVPKWLKHVDTIRDGIAAKPDASLDELLQAHSLPMSRSALWRAIEHLGITRKKSLTRRGAGPRRHRRPA